MPFITIVRTVAPLSGSNIVLFASPGDQLLETGSTGGTTVTVLDEDGDVVVPPYSPDVFVTSPTLLANGDIVAINSGAVVRYNPAGQIIDQTTGFTPGPGRATELTNGNILITYNDGGGHLRGQLLTPTLDLIGTNFDIAAATNFASDVTALTGGGFAVLGESSGTQSQSVRAFDANGALQGAPANAGEYYRSEIQALSDGGFVVVGTHLVSFPGLAVYNSYMQVFNADGSARTQRTTISNVVDSVSVAALDDGLFVVGLESRAQIYHVSGRALGDSIATPFFALEDGMEGIDADTFVSIGRQGSGGPTELIYWSVDRENILIGNANAETFDGAGATDRIMAGFGGDDVFNVDSAGDIVHEWAGEGNDTVIASVSYQLRAGAEVELLRTSDEAGTTALSLGGNELAQTIRGNAGDNQLTGGGGGDTLIGLGGNDFYFVGNANDVVQEAVGGGTDRVFASVSYTLAAGADVEMLTTDLHAGTAAINLTGNALAQGIFGNAGANQLNGGGGADSLVGFGGDDWYFIVDGRESVFESAGGGNDRIFTSVDYRLQAGASVETITTNLNVGTAGIDIIGNELAQLIYGNAGDNQLTGGGGGDAMVGLGGNDFFFVGDTRDVIYEATGGGNDRVFASLSFTLTAGAEVEMLTTDFNGGTAAINLTGNALVQGIFGNAGANQLSGGGGADSLVGFGGDDWYFITDGGEAVFESAGGGNDRIFTSVDYRLQAGAEVEILTTNLHAGTAAIDITGNELAQTIFGNAGGNILDGGGGKDELFGNGGADIFLFSTALNTAPGGTFAGLASTANVDQINGFGSDDKIGLDAARFGLTPGALPPGAFVMGTAAQDADDRIIYDQATGALLFDADGSGAGAAQLFAYIAGPFNLDASYFVVI
ncbi:MAG TPA: hypothetical protein VEX35_11395 [Allosphingosinicella sp.]|nr:hypothetical protein [Allosphingosinicella sp.]